MRTAGVKNVETSPPSAPAGYVHVAGDFVPGHRPEIEAVLRREEQRAQRASPVTRIIGYDEDGSGGLLISTTTEHLAHRLGHALKKELDGEVHHGFAHRNKLALVWWRR